MLVTNPLHSDPLDHNNFNLNQEEGKMNDYLLTEKNKENKTRISEFTKNPEKTFLKYIDFLMRSGEDMSNYNNNLDEKADVSNRIRIVINIGFSCFHSFKHNSLILKHLMLIIKDIRLLPESDYNLCIQAIHRLVMKQYLCPTCHGRGLVYLKFLTKYIDNNKYKRYENYYDYFVSLDNLDNNYEDYLTRLLNKYYNVHS
jgi:hypothetical protein